MRCLLLKPHPVDSLHLPFPALLNLLNLSLAPHCSPASRTGPLPLSLPLYISRAAPLSHELRLCPSLDLYISRCTARYLSRWLPLTHCARSDTLVAQVDWSTKLGGGTYGEVQLASTVNSNFPNKVAHKSMTMNDIQRYRLGWQVLPLTLLDTP